MKIIGAGFGRTGTMSTQAALEHLRYRCYHMNEVIFNPNHLKAWHQHVLGGVPMDWQQLFEGWDATVDFPACLFYQELLEVFPDARVLLNVRDPESWFESFLTLWRMERRLRRLRFIPKVRQFTEFVEAVAFDGLFGDKPDRTRTIDIFQRHNEKVKTTVPADRLLVFSVKDGWEPLCKFLGCEVPVGQSFPHLNEGSQATVRRLLRALFTGKDR